MTLYTTAIVIDESREKVFEHITNLNGYTKWLRDITYWEVVTKKIKAGSTQVQHRNFPLSQQLVMTVTGYKKNSYFRLEALSGGIALPAYTFSLRRLKANSTELTFTLEARRMVNRKTILAFYGNNIEIKWYGYLKTLKKLIEPFKEEEPAAPRQPTGHAIIINAYKYSTKPEAKEARKDFYSMLSPGYRK